MEDKVVWSLEEAEEHVLVLEVLVGYVGDSSLYVERVVHHLMDKSPHWPVFLQVDQPFSSHHMRLLWFEGLTIVTNR